jgi:hypothetical protein
MALHFSLWLRSIDVLCEGELSAYTLRVNLRLLVAMATRCL